MVNEQDFLDWSEEGLTEGIAFSNCATYQSLQRVESTTAQIWRPQLLSPADSHAGCGMCLRYLSATSTATTVNEQVMSVKCIAAPGGGQSRLEANIALHNFKALG